MDKNKNSWERPQLIVLGRSKPVEGVLAVCKDADRNTPGPNGKICTQAPTPCRDVASS